MTNGEDKKVKNLANTNLRTLILMSNALDTAIQKHFIKTNRLDDDMAKKLIENLKIVELAISTKEL